MKWLRTLWRRGPALDDALAARIAAWRMLAPADPGAALAAQRLIVVDVESSGLDPYRDRLISIGAVAVRAGTVRLSDVYATTLRQDRPSSEANILVHRIGGSAQVEGRDPAEALAGFLDYIGKAPLFAFNAEFDRVLIERSARAALGAVPDGPWLDLAALAPALCGDRAPQARTLDDWLSVYSIENAERHNALADALATAQLLLVVLRAAAEQACGTAAKLARAQENRRWLVRTQR
jgi:DNA polymerase-3 subunit epsilon